MATYLLNAAGLRALPLPLPNDEWDKMLEELGDTAPLNAPLLSDYAVSREGIYGDHD